MTVALPAAISDGVTEAPTGEVARLHLWRRAGLRRLLLLHALGQAADAIVVLALAQVVVFDIGQGASPGTIVRVIAIAMIPYLVACTIATRLSDRRSRRRSLMVVAGTRAALACAALAVPLSDHQGVGYIVWAMSVGAAGVAMNLRSAGLAHVAPHHALVAANSLSAICQRIAGVSGFVVSTALGTWSPLAALAFAAVLHLAAAVGYWSTGLDLGGGAAPSSATSPSPSKLRQLDERPTLAVVQRAVATALAHRAISAAAFVTFVLIIDANYQLEASGFAVAIGLVAIGTVVGTIAAPFVVARLGRRRTLVGSFLPASAVSALAALHTEPVVVMMSMIGISFVLQVIRLTTDATVQRDTADSGVGRALATYDRLYNLAYIGGAVAAITVVTPGSSAAFGYSAGAYAVCLALSASFGLTSRSSTPARTSASTPSRRSA